MKQSKPIFRCSLENREKEDLIKNTISLYKKMKLDVKIFSLKNLKYKTIWTNEEDRLLLSLVKNQNNRNWTKISSYFENKSAIQCSARFKRINPLNKKGKWTKEEDENLLKLMKIYGKNWSKITKHFKSRTGKQVRDRFVNVLDPNILKNKFSEEEDLLIMKLYNELGTNWAEISKYLSKRTPDMIKNRFYQYLRQKYNLG